MIVGLFIRMQRPNAVAAGMCLSMGMLPKADYLQRLGVPGKWPVFGKMRTVHCDNAKEFRGKTLEKALAEYGIDHTFRPVKQPEYGSYIERMVGNVNEFIHKQPGTTFSNPEHRGDYNSKKKSALTLKEIEVELIDWIVNQYHQRKHSTLGVSPIRKWEASVLGDRDHLGVGLPEAPADPQKLILDFMPFKTPTIQNYGIKLNGEEYYHENLNRWINAPDPDHAKRKRKFVVRYDPLSKRSVWFGDPEVKQYFEIPCRNQKVYEPKSGSYPAAVSWADGSQGGSGRVILATT
jgi:putative transposase